MIMAILQISQRSSGIEYELTPLKLLSVMLFPDDGIARTQWVAAAALSAPHSAQANRTDEIFTSLEILKMIAEAPSRDELMRRSAERAVQGKVAANILWLVLSLASSAPQHATVRKAIRVIGVHSARFHTDGTGRLPSDTTTIKKIWSRFKTVSHLWAAIQYQRSREGYSSGSLGDLMSPESVPEVLAIAKHIRVRGEGHRPPGGSTNSRRLDVSTLDPETTWKPPGDVALPIVKLKTPTPPKWVLEELRGYRAEG
jgi:hypothetical protein